MPHVTILVFHHQGQILKFVLLLYLFLTLPDIVSYAMTSQLYHPHLSIHNSYIRSPADTENLLQEDLSSKCRPTSRY